MKLQKRLASKILKAGFGRIKTEPGKEKEIKEAITGFDVKGLINKKIIWKEKIKGVSRSRANKIKEQKKKGRRKYHGSRKGTSTARTDPKKDWINRIRAQRMLIKRLKENNKITKETYKNIYRKSKGGFFRSINHIKLYLSENNLFKK